MPKRTKAKFIQAPISYTGGKYREMETISKLLPPPEQFDKCFDLFGGGGCVSLNLFDKLKKPTFYNDLSKHVVEFYQMMKDQRKLSDFIAGFLHEEPTRENLKLHSDRLYKTGDAVLYDWMFLKLYGFRGRMRPTPNFRDGKPEGIKSKTFEKWKKIGAFISDDSFHVLSEDAYDMLDKIKSDPNAFVYLDPPYIGTSCSDYSSGTPTQESLERIAKVMNDPDTKAKIMLQINFDGFSYDLFGKLMKEFHPMSYSTNSSKIIRRYILTACNY